MSHDEDDAMSPRRCRGFFGSPALSGMPQFVVLSTLQWPTRGCPASHLHCPRRKLCCTLFFFASSHWWSYRQLELTQFQNNHRNKKKKIKITKAKVCAQNAARSYEYRSAVLWQHISWSISFGQHPRPRGAIERGTYAKLIDFRFSSPRFGLVCYGTVCGMQFLRLLA